MKSGLASFCTKSDKNSAINDAQSWMVQILQTMILWKASSIVKDYTHKLLGEEKIDNYNCVLSSNSYPNGSGVVWGKIITWIVKEKFLEVKTDYYDEEGTLIKAFNGSNLKANGRRNIFAHWEMVAL